MIHKNGSCMLLVRTAKPHSKSMNFTIKISIKAIMFRSRCGLAAYSQQATLDICRLLLESGCLFLLFKSIDAREFTPVPTQVLRKFYLAFECSEPSYLTLSLQLTDSTTEMIDVLDLLL
jgi:hypothetical protein